MKNLHRLLERQLQRYRNGKGVPPEWEEFIQAVNEVYHQADDERRMLEHSMEVSSQELLQANQDLREKQAFLEQAQEVGHIGSWVSDISLDGKLVWSKECYRIFGVKEEDFDEKVNTFFFLIHPEDSEYVRKASLDAIAGIKPYNVEHRIIRPGGEVRWVHQRADIIRGSGGEPLKMIGIVQDITEQKNVEIVIKENEKKYQQILDAITDMVLVKGPKSRILWANKAFREHYGMTNEQLKDLIDAPFNEPDYTQQYIKDDQYVFETGNTLNIPDEPVTRHDGQIFLFNTVKSAIRDREGKVVMTVGVSRDITERKRSDDDLRKQTELLRTIFEHIPVMIAIMDKNGKVMTVNRHWQEVLGWSLEEARNRDMLKEFYPDEAYRSKVLAYILNPPKGWSDFRTRVKDGRVIDTTWANIILSDGRSMGIGQDISERKIAENAIRESEIRFRQLAENIQEVFWMTDLDKKQMLYISPGYEKIWGRTCESLYASPQSWLESIHEDDRERIKRLLSKQEIGDYDEEYRIIRGDGQVRWVRDRAFPIADESGHVYRLVGVAEDITEHKLIEDERKKTEEELKKNLNELKLLLSITVDRENVMVDLKKEINKLSAELNRRPPYDISFSKET